MSNTETVRALVSVFNIHNYARNTVKINFTLQMKGQITGCLRFPPVIQTMTGLPGGKIGL